jgi:hypothetical protein
MLSVMEPHVEGCAGGGAILPLQGARPAPEMVGDRPRLHRCMGRLTLPLGCAEAHRLGELAFQGLCTLECPGRALVMAQT